MEQVSGFWVFMVLLGIPLLVIVLYYMLEDYVCKAIKILWEIIQDIFYLIVAILIIVIFFKCCIDCDNRHNDLDHVHFERHF